MSYNLKIMSMTNTKIPGVSFSWRRALGITWLKRLFARATGIPTTKSGLDRKVGSTIVDALLRLLK